MNPIAELSANRVTPFAPQRASVAAAPVSPAPAPDNAGLASVHTDNLPEILRQLGISLFVTNYQGGKLIVVRPDRNTVNTHFLDFDKPMGLAADRDRLFVGTQTGIREFRSVPDVAKRLCRPIETTRSTFSAITTSRATSMSTRSHSERTTNAGSSIRASHVCARSTASTASGRAGGRASYRGCRRRIAVI